MDVTLASSRTPPGELAERARIFENVEARADRGAVFKFEQSLAGADLAAPPVVLPDFHYKESMEMPSSIAVATEGTIRPTLTSASVNCGMALIALDMEPPTERGLRAFFGEVRRRYPHPPGWRRELSASEVMRAAEEGAEFAVERYGLDSHALERIEENGRLDLEPYGGIERFRRELPWLSVQLSRLRFGAIGPGNHFIELQVVEEVMDRDAARRLGVEEGQMTLQYHGGGGVLAGQVGRLFGRRRKMNKNFRAAMAFLKPLFHLATARSASQIRERLALYFVNGCPPVPLDSAEGARLMLANAAAMNYGFAFRTSTYAMLCAEARRSWGLRDSRLVVDSPHNSIYEEEVEGRPAIVHRHNASRAHPAGVGRPGTAFDEVGQALLLPGTNRTSSYLCVADTGAAASLYSTCHGAGTVVERFARNGKSGPHPNGSTTMRFTYSDAKPVRLPHLDDRGVDAAMQILAENRLARPVARMRPVAGLT